MMQVLDKGMRVKSWITGEIYEINEFRGHMVILNKEDHSGQVLTDKENLKLFYEKVEKEIQFNSENEMGK